MPTTAPNGKLVVVHICSFRPRRKPKYSNDTLALDQIDRDRQIRVSEEIAGALEAGYRQEDIEVWIVGSQRSISCVSLLQLNATSLRFMLNVYRFSKVTTRTIPGNNPFSQIWRFGQKLAHMAKPQLDIRLVASGFYTGDFGVLWESVIYYHRPTAKIQFVNAEHDKRTRERALRLYRVLFGRYSSLLRFAVRSKMHLLLTMAWASRT